MGSAATTSLSADPGGDRLGIPDAGSISPANQLRTVAASPFGPGSASRVKRSATCLDSPVGRPDGATAPHLGQLHAHRRHRTAKQRRRQCIPTPPHGRQQVSKLLPRSCRRDPGGGASAATHSSAEPRRAPRNCLSQRACGSRLGVPAVLGALPIAYKTHYAVLEGGERGNFLSLHCRSKRY